MIGIDTNVLIRYIVQDDPGQSALATEFIEQQISEKQPGFISLIVVCEIVWVLKRGYHYNKETISRILSKLLLSNEIIIESSNLVWNALNNYIQGQADFADYLIAQIHQNAGCSKTVTFDQIASNAKYFELIH